MVYDDIFFDCDSTLSAIEGIDALARLKGAGERIAALTNAAMNGGLRLEQVYGERLRLIQPNRADLAVIAEQYRQAVVPGAREVVAALQAAGKRVFIISGGLSDAVIPFGVWLGVPEARIRAVGLRYDAEGGYAGYDEASPLTTQTGKTAVITALRAPGRRALLVGDGSSDAAAAGAVDLFVGYGGVIFRPNVEENAPVYLYANDLWPVVQLATGDLLADEQRTMNS